MSEAVGHMNKSRRWWKTGVCEEDMTHYTEACVRQAFNRQTKTNQHSGVLQTCCDLLLLLSCLFCPLIQCSQGSPFWPKFILSMECRAPKVYSLKVYFILLHRDSWRQPSHTPNLQGLISRKTELHYHRQMNLIYCKSCFFPIPKFLSLLAHIECIVMSTQRM